MNSKAVALLLFWTYIKFVYCHEKNDYCIIGAGPSGLQIGYFLHSTDRDYQIFERNSVPGSFYVNLPIHRLLISINKGYTGKTNKEFNMRHDWNSLISDNDSLLFTKYSNEYFPQADDYLKYLSDFQTNLGLNVQFKSLVEDIAYRPGISKEHPFSFMVNKETVHRCKYIIMATGVNVPNKLNITGWEMMDRYETMDPDPKAYEGQSVLIIGRGNSGMEVAKSIYGVANYVHLVGRSRIKLSWETHYVGDIRGVNNDMLDAYMLKSLDGVLEAASGSFHLERQKNGKIALSRHNIVNDEDNNSVREGYDRVIQCLGFHFNNSFYTESTRPETEVEKSKGKYPKMLPNYESTTTPGMYFAGTITHSLDFRKSAGGFIHGFRYTSRVLHRLLEYKNHGVLWPAKEYSHHQHLTATILKRANEASGIYQMFTNLIDVAIVDMIDGSFKYLEEFPAELIPSLSASTGYNITAGRHAVVVLSLEYGKGFSKAGADHFHEDRSEDTVNRAHKSNFLHPVIYFYRHLPKDDDMITAATNGNNLPIPDGLHHVLEDFTTQFDGIENHVFPLHSFIETMVGQELRVFSVEHCIELILTGVGTLPANCDDFLMTDWSSVSFM